MTDQPSIPTSAVPQPDSCDSTIAALTDANNELRDSYLNMLSEISELQAANESKHILLAQTYEVLVNSTAAENHREFIEKIARELHQIIPSTPQSNMISPGKISKGMVLTVLEWEPIVHEADGIFTMTTTTHRDNSWKGSILDVEAVQLPFVVVRERDDRLSGTITLDTRHVTLMKLTPEFVEAATRKKVSST